MNLVNQVFHILRSLNRRTVLTQKLILFTDWTEGIRDSFSLSERFKTAK